MSNTESVPTDALAVNSIAVIGAGTMGHGVALVAARVGFLVTLCEVDRDALARGIRSIEANLQKGIGLGKVTAEEADATLQRIRGTVELGQAAAVELVIEAAPEKLELKQRILREIEASAPASTIFATNTSSLSITEIARASVRPAQVIGMHFFNPVHLMRLVELVVGEQTAPQTVETALEVTRRLRKDPITVKDVPGFASSRLGVALGLEAMRMVEQGVASAADIDKAMELGYNHPMGPLKLTDVVGLDVRLNIAEYLHTALGAESFRPPEILREMVAAGKLGKKSGEGFYRWDDKAAGR